LIGECPADVTIGIVNTTTTVTIDDIVITIRTCQVLRIPSLRAIPTSGDEGTGVGVLLASIVDGRSSNVNVRYTIDFEIDSFE